MPALVAGAGYLAGAYLASKIIPEKKPLSVDTKISGVTEAKLGKSPQTGQELNVAQVDPTQALAYFMQGAETSQGYYTTGLSMYQGAIEQAKQEIKDSYGKANNALRPLASGATSAFNEMLRYVGIDPISKSYGLSDQAANLSPAAVQQMQAAEQIKDPNERARAKAAILNQLTSDTSKLTDVERQAAIAAGTTAAGDRPVRQIIKDRPGTSGAIGVKNPNDSYISDQEKADAQYAIDLKNWQNKQTDSIQNSINTATANKLQQGQQLIKDYSSSYTDNYDAGYTGDQATEKLRSTPGYQFRMSQGTEALERSASAKGNLMSGGTAGALVKYGQGLADQTFQQTLANLASISSMGIPAQMQIAENEKGIGSNMASLDTMYGNAAASTYNLIGNQYANAYNNSGNSYLQSAIFNAGEQNRAMTQDRNNQAQYQQQALASGPSYMNAQTASNNLSYDVFKGQQAGQAATGGNNNWNILPIGGYTGSAGNPAASYNLSI